jgi:hypothetical protein
MSRTTLHKAFFGGLALVFLAAPAVVFFAAEEAAGTDSQMLLLPAYSKYRCAVCHTTATPTPQAADLNAFGTDFKANGSLWDATLAGMNSDGDRCSNGFELGDRNGDGIYDDQGANNVVENGNPGNPNDCTVPVDAKTWGIIKDIFRNEIREFIEDPGETYDLSLHFG